MKKRTLLLTAITGIVYLTMTSYRDGPAFNSEGNKTGSPGSNGTCNNCHSGGATLPTGAIEVRIKSGGITSPPVNYYQPGETYLITLRGSHPTLNHFGFQMVAQKDADNSNVGTFSSFPGTVRGVPSTNPTIVEHNQAIPENATGEYVVQFDWKAPAGNTGNVTLYAIINAVNNDNSFGGDIPSVTISAPLADKTSVGKVTREVVIKAYPNPVQDKLTIDMNLADAGMYTYQVVSMLGSVVDKGGFEIAPGNYQHTINSSAWAPGMYNLQIQKDGNMRTLAVVK